MPFVSQALDEAGRVLWRRNKILLCAGVTAVTILAGAVFYDVTGPPVHPRVVFSPAPRRQAGMPDSSLLGLKAEKVASDYRLTWNSGSSAVSRSEFGVLSIHGGNGDRRIVLYREQLRSGHVLYGGPLDGGVNITLDVVAADQSVNSESLTLGSPATASIPRIMPAERQELPSPRPVAVSPEVHDVVANTAQRSAAPPPPQPAPAANPPVRSFRLPASSIAAAKPTAQPALPAPPPPQPAPAAPPLPAVASLRLPPSVPAPQPVFHGPQSGRLIWTGSLDRRGVVEIDGGHASVGVLMGALPGVPVSCRVLPAEFGDVGLVVYTNDAQHNGRLEPASAANGWNLTRYRWDPDRVREIAVLEAPNPSNGFKRLVLRNDSRKRSVILIDWSAP
jgi:hypothetical protein